MSISDYADFFPYSSNSVDHSELRVEIEEIKMELDNQDKNIDVVFRCLNELIEKMQ